MGSTATARIFYRSILPITHQWHRTPTNAPKLLKQVRAFSQAPPDENAFQVTLDVRHFTAKEIAVKTFQNSIIIEGNHEEHKEDDSYIERHFIRKYTLPKECEHSEIKAELSPDGVLTLKIPTPHTAIDVNHNQYRTVPILRVKQGDEKDKDATPKTEGME